MSKQKFLSATYYLIVCAVKLQHVKEIIQEG